MSGEIAELYYDANRSKWRFLWGGETFYDKSNQLIEFNTSLEALEWINKEHPQLTIKVREGEQMTLDLSDDE